MNDNLIPQHRTDKNGRVVKRWVKTEPAVEKKRIPLAPVTPAPNRKAFCLRLCDVMVMNVFPSDIKELSDDSILLLDNMLDTINETPDDQACLAAWIGPYAHYESDHNEEIRLVASHHRMNEGVPLSETLRYVRGLYGYSDQFDHDQLQALIDVSVVAAEAIITSDRKSAEIVEVFQSFFDGDAEDQRTGEYWIRDESFVNLVTSRLEDVPAIISLVKERGILDAQAIEEILDSGSHSVLLEGSL